MLILLGIAGIQAWILYQLLGQLIEFKRSKVLKRLCQIGLYITCLMPLQGGDLENAYFIFCIYIAISILGATGSLSRKVGNTFLFYAMTLAIKMISVRIEWLIGGDGWDVYAGDLIEITVSTIGFYLIYKLFKQVMARTKEIISDRIWLWLIMIALATVGMVVMSMQMVVDKGTPILNLFVIGLMGICLISSISIFFIIEQIAKGAREESHRKELEWELEHYNDIKESQDQTRKVLHDMKNHIGAIHAMLYAKQVDQATSYLNQIAGELGEQKSIIYCQHQVANAILNNKVKKMKEAQITYTIQFDVPNEIGLDQMEVGSILANTIDNAIEACLKVDEIEKRQIQIKAIYKKGKLMYEINNTKANLVTKHNKRFITSKSDKANHGYGLRQVEEIINKHKGILEVGYEEAWFRITIIM